MLTCEYNGAAFTKPRSHPWTDTADNSGCRYYNLTTAPERIRSSLEDFLPWDRYPAIEAFYTLLSELNQSGSILETNDCAFSGPDRNENPSFEKSLQCSGRVMVLFRELERNTTDGEIENLTYQLHCQLAEIDVEFRWGIIGTTIVPVRLLALPDVRGQQLGSQLMISFWTWGNSESENMQNLGRVVKNLSSALRNVVDSNRRG